MFLLTLKDLTEKGTHLEHSLRKGSRIKNLPVGVGGRSRRMTMDTHSASVRATAPSVWDSKRLLL